MFIEAFEHQNAKGKRDYGTVLQTHNGRDFGVDALQELADVVNYLGGLIMEHNEALMDIALLQSEVDELLYRLGESPKYGGQIG
jgi:hypothetical protein